MPLSGRRDAPVVLVCGSRDYPNRAVIKDVIDGLALKYGDGLRIIHGACRGADTIAAERAKFLGLHVTAYPAHWDLHGKRAGFLRNLEMIDKSPDHVVAFQCHGSRGTQHTINEARKRGIPVTVFNEDGKVAA